MVPNGWEKTDLTHLINIKHGFAFKSEYFREIGEYILLTPGSFYEKGGFKDQKEKTKYYIGEIPDSYLLTKNDLLIAMTEQASGLLGSALFVPEKNTYLHNQRLGKVEIKAKERIDLNFLYLTFNSPLARKQISEQSTGTKVKHTSPDKLKSIICLLPPLPEQQKIAKILSTWDKAIGTTERLIDNSIQQKKALMQQLLTGKKRLLDESGKRFEDEWEEATLGKYVTIKSGVSPSKFKLESEGEIPYVKVEDMNNCSKYQIHSRNYADETKSVIFQGAVIFPKRGAAIMNNKVRIAASKLYLDSNMMALIPNKSINSEFLYYLLVKKQLFKIADTSTIPQINNKHITPYAFKLPSLSEQQKIATVLTNADKEIELLEQQLADLQQEKKALMQVLLTGKKRVVV